MPSVDFKTNDEIKGYCVSAIFRVIPQILGPRLIVSRFARMLARKRYLSKTFSAHSRSEIFAKPKSESAMKSQYSESLLSIDLEKYSLHSTMANCLISRHIIQQSLSSAKPRLEMLGCLARLCAPIISTKLIIYHFFGHVGGLTGIMPCLTATCTT